MSRKISQGITEELLPIFRAEEDRTTPTSQVLEQYDAVFIDTSYIHCLTPPDINLTGLIAKAYATRFSKELLDPIRKAEIRSAYLKEIAAEPRVTIISEVINELRGLEDHVRVNLPSKRKKWENRVVFRDGGRGARKRRKKKAEKAIKKKQRATQIVSPVEGCFNRLYANIQGISESIHLYEGERLSLPRAIAGPSETDYRLVEAALGFAGEEKKACILSNDQDHPIILGAALDERINSDLCNRVVVYRCLTPDILLKAHAELRYIAWKAVQPKRKKEKNN
ncbi:hypothetical protein HOI26_03510 [Candidatus Woesearchaeota archaeon]|jgi:hypothetical protein|nr:hypothetical protein [Candidatus Woesearchaeota archaeon]MBT5740143.1 hypothetical protein [Candidatus Woesearchaeota archaeon]